MPTQPNPCDLLRLLAEQMEAEARARLKTAKALAAVAAACSPSTCSEHSPEDSQNTSNEPIPKPPGIPESKAMARLFNRKETNIWSVKEIKAFKAAAPTLEDIEMVAAYYEAERAKGDDGIHRRDLQTCLNNWCGEVDRARAFATKKAAPVVKGLDGSECRTV